MHDYQHHRKKDGTGMVIKGEECDSIRLARAGCRRWQSVLFALRLYKGERSLNAFGKRQPRSVRANIETRRIDASMIALPSFPPSSGLPRPQDRPFSLSRAPVLQHPEQWRRPLEVVSGNLGEWVTSRDLALRRASRRRLNLSGDILGYHPPHPVPSLALWDGVKPYETGYKHPIVSGVTLDSGDRPRWHWVATTRGFLRCTTYLALQAATPAHAWTVGWFAGQNCNVITYEGYNQAAFVQGCTQIGLTPEPHSFEYNGNGTFMLKACTGSACDGECVWRGPGVAGCTNRTPEKGPYRSFLVVAA
ncbi:hypothetical protein FA13DRAFT_1706134 [Coprinellus micaceus]|uniref:Uncharacterized protein n=1 Tax=Coprinellus micaceus TaxID=71717 RepID=A0A4Y7TSJ0_COPMI|nr:hypothetical protein FA13DRAFT_1706134 [Coprinellus micaceus]